MKKHDLKILIVDDDPEIGDILADLCAINGYQSELASNGAEAMKLMRKNGTYDLAIVDFLMPVMSGAEFIKRAREEKADFPIIVISACDDVEDAFIAAGANFFLKKPFDPHLLEKAIEVIARGVFSSQNDLLSVNPSKDDHRNSVEYKRNFSETWKTDENKQQN